MSEIYGNSFLSSYGDAPNETWIAALQYMTGEQIKQGLHDSMKYNLKWPPTLTEFVSYCKPRINAMHTMYQLPHLKPVDRATGIRNVKKLLDIMKEKGESDDE